MTPLQIGIMLHYHACAVDYREGDFSAPAVRYEIDEFKRNGMLQESAGGDVCYELTEKGSTYVNALMAVPEPKMQWVVEYPNSGLSKAMEG